LIVGGRRAGLSGGCDPPIKRAERRTINRGDPPFPRCPHVHPSPPASRRTFILAPYVVCFSLVAVMLPAQSALRPGEVGAALAIQAALGLGLAVGDRLTGRRWCAIAGILAYLFSVALLRDGAGGNGGYGALVFLPVLWAALRGRRAELVTAIVATSVVFFAPAVLIGGPQYPGTAWRVGVLVFAMCTSIGVAVLGLVSRLRAQTEHSLAILGAMSEGFALTRDGVIVAVNPALCRMTGLAEDELVGAGTPFPFWDPDLEESTELLRRHIVAAGGGEFELVLRRADGTRFPAAITATPTVLDGGGRAFLNTIRDITAQREHESAQRRHIDRLRSLASVARAVGHSDPLDARHTICGVALELCEGAGGAVIWERADDGSLVTTSTRPDTGMVHRVGAERTQHGGHVVWRSGRPLFVADAATSPHCDPRVVQITGARSVHFQPIAGGRGVRGVLALTWPEPLAALPEDVGSLLEVLADEAAIAMHRADLLARLDELTRTDELTGLPNRRAWDEVLARELESARRHGHPLSVAMLDLDRFKDYNDEHGHLAGDRLLRRAADHWQAALRVTDVLARWGGEEFALLLPGCDGESAEALIERLRGGLPGGVTFSAGVAGWDRHIGGRALVDQADRALYDAKAAGRDRVVIAA
jgi:diguanylate cyclase (GGDEF)-like protein/PAS domain S-box-containing protein